MTWLRNIFLAVAVLFLPLTAAALDVPKATGYVVDQAGLLNPSTRLKIEQFLEGFEKSDSTQLAVLTIPSLEGEALEEYAIKVAEQWGIGQQGKDNGALLLVAKAERKVRIEVGYGLEGRLTDLLAGRIIDYEITPRFKQGDFDGGILAGVASMAEAVRGEYQGTGRTGQKKKRNPWGMLALLLFLGPGLLLLERGPRSSHHRRSSFWIGGPPFGGGRGGGGFGGFGGGGFGGGGSSGGW
ncbi:TPM domain-containing protein [Trichloromonas sp.]|uniref:TPM domain-containing protein n=1 Tax=Trichloromonas sp. TaxID=3069249 RepID=UPI003D815E63